MTLQILSLLSLPPAVRALFEKQFDVQDSSDSRSAGNICAASPDVLLCSIDVKLDRKYLSSLPRSLKAVATYSVGCDHIDLAAARELGIAVFNTPEALGDSVADIALLLLLGAARRATESINLIRGGQWAGWKPTQLLGYELAGKKLGLLGMGDIGRKVAARARAFGMSVAYTNRSGSRHDAEYVSDPLDLIASSDALVLACPSTSDTRHIVNRDTLKHASRTMILINISRGDLVRDEDLIGSLSRGEIFAAGLDVFETEPEIDPRYLELPNVFMLPHVGSSTIEARLKMGAALVSALEDWAEGRRPRNQIV